MYSYKILEECQIGDCIKKQKKAYEKWLKKYDLEDSQDERERFFPTAFRLECDEVIKDWNQIGGFLNCCPNNYSLYYPLYICEEEEYFEYIKAEGLEDTEENQKEFCRLAIEGCGAYSDEEVDGIMRKCWG